LKRSFSGYSASLHAARAIYDPRRPNVPWLIAIDRNWISDGARHCMRRSANEVTAENVPVTMSDKGTNTSVMHAVIPRRWGKQYRGSREGSARRSKRRSGKEGAVMHADAIQ
jgi:hypothetical protein